MVIDSSALLAILQNEPERRAFNESIEVAEQVLLSTASFVEISMIVESRLGADGVRDLDLFIAKARIILIPADEEQAHLAAQAFRRYGKGRHPAALNFGDCFAYALARAQSDSLLFKGNDFSHTDIECHPASYISQR
jgi:ribonuclease VapC